MDGQHERNFRDFGDEPCGKRARNVITGMVDVINALGFEVVGDWEDYRCNFAIVPAVLVADALKH